jgi:hypothetical protein
VTFQTSALILSWAAILLLALVVSGLIRQVHALAAGPRRVGPRPGTPAPGLAGLAPPGRPRLLLFLSPDCRTCAEALAEAAGAGRPVLALYPGTGPAEVAGGAVTVHTGQVALFDRYDVVATPYAVVVDEAGRVAAAEPVGSRAALRDLLARTAASMVTSTAGGRR